MNKTKAEGKRRAPGRPKGATRAKRTSADKKQPRDKGCTLDPVQAAMVDAEYRHFVRPLLQQLICETPMPSKPNEVIESTRHLIQARVNFFFEPSTLEGLSNIERALQIVDKMRYGNNSDMAHFVGTPMLVGMTQEVTKLEVLP